MGVPGTLSVRTATWIRVLPFVMSAASVAALAARQAPGQAPQDSTPRFRSGVELVDVAVTVRDADGRFVRDLGAADFEVREDGQPQRVVAFERVEISVPASAPGEPAVGAVPADVGSNEGPADFRLFVIVLDAVHVSSQRTPYVREHAKRFIEEYMAPGDLAAVFSPGALEEATQDFTRDKARLLAAIDRFAGSKLRSATVERHEEAKQGEGVGMILHGGRDPDDGERAIRSRALTGSLEALARHLDRIRGRRKTLLLFTEGVDYDLTDVNGTLQRYGADVMRGLGRALGALQRSNVAVYPIDPRGLSSAEGDLVETPIYEPERRDPNAPTVHTEFGTSIRWMRTLAEATGGFAVVDRNDYGPAYARILEESSHYYVLGYSPARPAKPGESRAIAVTVARPGVQVFARKGYTVPAASRAVRDDSAFFEPAAPVGPPGRPRTGRAVPLEVDRPAARPGGVDSTLAELLASPLPAAGLPIRVQAVPLRGSGRRTTVGLVIEVMGRPLTFTARGDRFEERLELALLTVDGRGRGSNGTSTRIDLRLTPEEAERVRTTGVRWLSRLELPPGRHQIRVAGRSTGTGLTGVATHEIDVPSFDGKQAALGGITLTSLPSVLMLTRGDAWLGEAIPTPPSAERRFVAGDRITAAAEVHLPEAGEGAAEVSARVDWPDGSRTPIGARTLKAPGRQSVAFAVDTRVLAPGRFVLRLTLSAPGREPVERAVPFEVLARQ